MMLVVQYILILCVFVSSCLGRKNVLFLVVDDMRPQLTAYRGKNYPVPVSPKMHTPNLDLLASRSLLLERAYVQQALCSPSRTSLLTGRRPDTTHVYECGPYFRDVGGNFTTIPGYFKQNGYVSVGMGKVFPHKPIGSGGDDPVSWSEPYFQGVGHFESRTKSWDAISDDLLLHKPLIDQVIADHAIKTLKRLAPAALSGKQPFFLAAGFHKPHLPFVFPKSFLSYYPEVGLPENSYAPVNMPAVAWFNYPGLRSRHDIQSLNASGNMNTTLPDDTVLLLRRAYYAALTYTDFLIGRVLTELKYLGLSNNTIVSFWSDHGYQLGEHGEWCKQSNFELAVHAPMMVHIPGKTDKGIKTEQLTEFVDLFPTLAEAAELEPLPLCPKNSTDVQLCREGTSLMPLIDNPTSAIKHAAFSQYPRKEGKVMGYTMRTDRYRYTEWVNFKNAPDYTPDWDKLHGVELYDHKLDPQENINCAYDPKNGKLRGELHNMLIRGWRNALAG